MPQTGAVRTNEIQNHAEHVHDQAAASKGASDHLNGPELQRERQEKGREAHERAEKLVKDAEKK